MAGSRAWVSWSCGKDGAWALHELRAAGEAEVAGLLTTVEAEADVVTMSRVPAAIARAQASALGLALHTVALPWPCPNDVYEQRTAAGLAAVRGAGADTIAYGDLFLDDVRAYREATLVGSGLGARFPLWGAPTGELARRMLEGGLRATIVCVDPAQAPAWLAGRAWDERLLRELPARVDPCGENGEFHTVVTDGPGFASALDVVLGDVVERDGFLYAPPRLATGTAGSAGATDESPTTAT